MKAIWNNLVIAESNNTQLVEGNHYFPPESVRMEYLQPSDTPYTCPWKGVCQYYNLTNNGITEKDAGWGYPDPNPEAMHIKRHIAFNPKVTIQE